MSLVADMNISSNCDGKKQERGKEESKVVECKKTQSHMQ